MRSIFLIIFSVFTVLYSQNCDYQIEIEFLDLSISPTEAPDTFIYDRGDGNLWKIFLKSCDGDILFEQHDSKTGAITVKGSFHPSVELLRRYEIFIDPLSLKETKVVKVVEYFHPLPYGVWEYYDESGEIAFIREFEYRIVEKK